MFASCLVRVVTRMRLIPIFLCSLLPAGCGDVVDPAVANLQKKLVVESVPSGEVSVQNARKAVRENKTAEQINVVVRGRINAGELPPWETGKAAFVMTDATGHSGKEEHDPHTCPFCSRNIQEMMVRVEFRDEQDQLLSVDARQLFNVIENQLVVVEGRGTINDSDILVLNASHIYIKR